MDNIIIEKCKNSFEVYRNYYKYLSFKEKQEIIQHYHVLYPYQQHHHTGYFRLSFLIIKHEFQSILKVIEFGAFDGKLAWKILKDNPEIEWNGYDISHVVINKMEHGLKKLKYTPHYLNKELWELNIDPSAFNVFVSSHSLEHISNKELLELMKWINGVKYMIIQVPLSKDWKNYSGCHHMTFERNDLEKILYDYKIILETGNLFWLLKYDKGEDIEFS